MLFIQRKMKRSFVYISVHFYYITGIELRRSKRLYVINILRAVARKNFSTFANRFGQIANGFIELANYFWLLANHITTVILKRSKTQPNQNKSVAKHKIRQTCIKLTFS